MNSAVVPYRARIRHAVEEAARDINWWKPTGIRDAMYAAGTAFAQGDPIGDGDVSAILEELRARFPDLSWSKVRLSERRKLLSRYWEIPEAGRSLQQAGLPSDYHWVLKVLRRTSRGNSMAQTVEGLARLTRKPSHARERRLRALLEGISALGREYGFRIQQSSEPDGIRISLTEMD